MKIISGMQTGVDIAGIKFAKDNGFEYGGFMPKNFRTECGNKPQYLDLYNAIESPSWNYLERTELNVWSSDLTLIFDLKSGGSSGSKHTKTFCEFYNKQYLYFTKTDKDLFIINKSKQIIDKVKPKVINIAGNRESSCPGIEKQVYKLLEFIFDIKTFNGLKNNSFF